MRQRRDVDDRVDPAVVALDQLGPAGLAAGVLGVGRLGVARRRPARTGPSPSRPRGGRSRTGSSGCGRARTSTGATSGRPPRRRGRRAARGTLGSPPSRARRQVVGDLAEDVRLLRLAPGRIGAQRVERQVRLAADARDHLAVVAPEQVAGAVHGGLGRRDAVVVLAVVAELGPEPRQQLGVEARDGGQDDLSRGAVENSEIPTRLENALSKTPLALSRSWTASHSLEPGIERRTSGRRECVDLTPVRPPLQLVQRVLVVGEQL